MPESPTLTYALIAISTALITLVGNYLVKKNDNSSNVKIAEINVGKEDFEKTKKKLQNALISIKDLKEDLVKEKEIRLRIEKRFDVVKIVYRIIFKQYDKKFKNDPDSLTMLEELNSIIND